jgi:hypothetical protein
VIVASITRPGAAPPAHHQPSHAFRSAPGLVAAETEAQKAVSAAASSGMPSGSSGHSGDASGEALPA